MSRQSLFASALLISVAAISSMASSTYAQEVEVPFNGTVNAACEFAKPEAGILAVNDSTLPTQLSSKNTGGQAGNVLLKCNTSAAVKAASYKATGQEFKVAKATFTVSNGTEEGQEVKVGSGETKIAVNLSLDSATPIPAGNYSYNVLVTAAP